LIYFIPTPIGNLDDISLRSLKILSEIEVFFCEDTRITKKLLSLLAQRNELSFQAKKFISLHSHNEQKVLETLDKTIFEQNVAYVSDAGMPCISDPGAFFIRYAQENWFEYEVLPGANAALLAYASSGFNNSRFLFYGFLPHKGKERTSALEEVLYCSYPVIVYESPHRLEKFIEELLNLIPERRVCFIKEATKKFETKIFGRMQEVAKQLKQIPIKGEWVIVIENLPKTQGEAITQEDILALNLPPKQKAKLLAKVSGKSVKECYNALS
jgi:16S rRNA (cytidine1402-2'-O)-methyltransferase